MSRSIYRENKKSKYFCCQQTQELGSHSALDLGPAQPEPRLLITIPLLSWLKSVMKTNNFTQSVTASSQSRQFNFIFGSFFKSPTKLDPIAILSIGTLPHSPNLFNSLLILNPLTLKYFLEPKRVYLKVKLHKFLFKGS